MNGQPVTIAAIMSVNPSSTILTPTTKRSLSDAVTDRLREAILNGKFEAGERLREEMLSSSLRVSRGPVREALVNLEREGLIIVYRNRGAFVARLSLADLDEVYSLRRALEPLAVQCMMQRNDAAPFDALQQVIADLDAACARGITPQKAAELDLRFHDIIYQASQHRRLYDCWNSIQSQIHILLLTRHVATQGFRKSIVKRHQELLDAIRSGDEQIALAALDSHLSESYELVSKNYQRQSKA